MSKQIVEFEKKAAEIEAANPADRKAVWVEIDNFLYKKDKNGEWVRNANGKRVIAWDRVLLKLGQLIALIVKLITMHEEKAAQPEPPTTPTSPTPETPTIPQAPLADNEPAKPQKEKGKKKDTDPDTK